MLKRIRCLFALALLIVASQLLVSARGVAAQSVVQSYQTGSSLQPGLIVQLKNNSDTVVPLSENNIAKMFGVVVNPSDATVSLSSSTNANQAFVATTGDYTVLVSNQAGPIFTGDYVTISSLEGIGMKAGTTNSIVLGKALSSFTGSADSINTTQLKTSSGKTTTVYLGLITVSINVTRNPLLQNSKPDLPSFLLIAGQNVANGPVSSTKIYLALLVLVISALIAGSMLYAGVRSSIISVGRNPLSKHTIFRSMFQVTLTSLMVFIIGLFAVYLLLRI